MFNLGDEPHYTWDEPWYKVARPYMRSRLTSRFYAAVRAWAKNQVLACWQPERGLAASDYRANAVQPALARRKMADQRSPSLAALRRLHLRARVSSR